MSVEIFNNPLVAVILIIAGLISIYYSRKYPTKNDFLLFDFRIFLFGAITVVIGVVIIIKYFGAVYFR